MLKKFLISLSLVVGLSASAATTSITIPAAGISNLLQSANLGSVKITQIIAVSPVNNTTGFKIYDTPTNQLTYTNLAYSNILSYGSNYVTTWTNYYGVTNSVTNYYLVDVTNSVAEVDGIFYPLRVSAILPTNASIKFDNVNYYFQNGAWITNTGAGSVTLTVTYQQ